MHHRPWILFSLLLTCSMASVYSVDNTLEQEKIIASSESTAEPVINRRNTDGGLAATPQDILNKGFKKPSNIAIQQGKARLRMEEMIFTAEQKLKTAATARSTPGSLLAEEEIIKIYEESGCEDSRRFNRLHCFDVPTVNQFRSIDGTCNNVNYPLQGASDTAFRRLIKPVYEDGISSPRGLAQAQDSTNFFKKPYPSARHISHTIVSDSDHSETPFSHLLMQFGQFLDHDLDLTPELETECNKCTFTKQCMPIRVKEDDPKFGIGTPQNGDCLTFRRSTAVCNTDNPGTLAPREQINVLTSYIDGSMVYGSNQEQAFALRAFKDGRLKVGPVIGDGDSLPVDDNKPPIVACPGKEQSCFLTGDVRGNEQVSLTVMHTLWVREHNRIAKELKHLNPIWSDERLYQEARKIVGAMIQKIVYYDYLPKVLGQEVFNIVVGKYKCYSKYVDASVPNAFATAAFRFGHSLIRPTFPRLAPDYSAAQPPLTLPIMFNNPAQYSASSGVSSIARGWVDVDSRHIDEFLNDVLTSKLFETSAGPGMDLASLNIQRHRDHGIPTYGAWKKFCSKKFLNLQSPTFENQTSEALLKNLHGVKENAELWVAGLAEKKLPGSLLGPTFACIFGLTFRNIRVGDRLYFERKGTFTKKQLKQLQQTSISRIICDNTDSQTIQPDAFFTNQTRVSCNSLPKVTLDAWKEETCFVHVQAPSGQTIVGISQLGHHGGKYATYANSNKSLHRCLPILCPSHQHKLAVMIFSAPQSSLCTYTTSNTFTSQSGNSVTLYREQIQKGHSEVFTSLHACEQSYSSQPAVSFSCLASSNGGSSGDTSPVNDPESSEYNGSIPNDVAARLATIYRHSIGKKK